MNYCTQLIDPTGLGIETNEQEYKECCIRGDKWPIEEMVEDEGNYIHQSKIEEYLKGFERDMLAEDLQELRNKLYKQVK